MKARAAIQIQNVFVDALISQIVARSAPEFCIL